MRNQGILIVDDDDEYREHLVKELSEDYLTVAGAASGDEAIAIVADDPSAFQFAVVDHQLGSAPDGIETTRRLVGIAPQLYPVVFSNVQVDSSPQVMEYKYEALGAGAYRYLEWTKNDPRKGIHDFVSEINQLASLRDWMSEFFAARAAAPSLLTQLDVGVDIIDRHFKIWFMNDAMRRIVGLSTPGLPALPCAHWHGFSHYPCQGCLVAKTLGDAKPHAGMFLCPYVFRDEDRVFFIKVWTQPVTDESGKVVLAGDEDERGYRSPLAVMESVQDLTDSPELRAMSLTKRLQIIASSLAAMGKEGFAGGKRFRYCRMYTVDFSGAGNTFVLRAAAGDERPPNDLAIDLRNLDRERLERAEENVRNSGYGYGFAKPSGFDPALPARQRTPYIYCPILENNRTVALIEVGCDDIEKETAALLRPYAREFLDALRDDRARMPEAIAVAASRVSEVELALQTKTSAEEQLRTIVEKACELTDSHQYVLRYRGGDEARLVRLKIPRFCDYEAVARFAYPLGYEKSWSCRTIATRAETLLDIASNGRVIAEFRTHLEEPAREALREANALCYEPLILDGLCIGILGLHSRKATNYRDDKKIAIVRSLARRATIALHDYMIEQESREKAEADALSDVLGLVLHNLKTPLATAAIAFDRLVSRIEAQLELPRDWVELVGAVRTQLSQIGNFREEVLKLKRPSQSRLAVLHLPDFLRSTVERAVTGSPDISTTYQFEPELETVSVDEAAMKLCLEVLLQNAVDAMEEIEREKHLVVILRLAGDTENRMIESPRPGLAVDVVDNGVGIPEDIARGLFRKMASRKPKGLGMGLLHCRAFALSAKGGVFYSDAEKIGARFTLIFPYERETEV